jgi:chemotaxis signal transduction protein
MLPATHHYVLLCSIGAQNWREVFFMMATNGIGEDPGDGDLRAQQRIAVAWKHRGTLISVGVRSVCGCTKIEKLSRVPGSQETVKGVISFKGEIVPVLSLLERSIKGATSEGKAEDYAIVLSMSGVKFAVEVKDIPRVIRKPDTSDSPGSNLCTMRQRHLERFVSACLSEAISYGGAKDAGVLLRQEKGSRVEGDGTTSTSETCCDDKNQTAAVPTGRRCAVEEGVTWKRP